MDRRTLHVGNSGSSNGIRHAAGLASAVAIAWAAGVLLFGLYHTAWGQVSGETAPVLRIVGTNSHVVQASHTDTAVDRTGQRAATGTLRGAYYMTDDVQYFASGPVLNPPRESAAMNRPLEISQDEPNPPAPSDPRPRLRSFFNPMRDSDDPAGGTDSAVLRRPSLDLSPQQLDGPLSEPCSEPSSGPSLGPTDDVVRLQLVADGSENPACPATLAGRSNSELQLSGPTVSTPSGAGESTAASVAAEHDENETVQEPNRREFVAKPLPKVTGLEVGTSAAACGAAPAEAPPREPPIRLHIETPVAVTTVLLPRASASDEADTIRAPLAEALKEEKSERRPAIPEPSILSSRRRHRSPSRTSVTFAGPFGHGR